MTLTPLKNQVLDVSEKTKEVINRFIEFCKRLGGDIKRLEGEEYISIGCIVPQGLLVDAAFNEEEGLKVSASKIGELGWSSYYDIPVDELPEDVTISYNVEELSSLLRGGLVKSLTMGRGFLYKPGEGRRLGTTSRIEGYFRKVELIVTKDYSSLDLWLGLTPSEEKYQ